MECRVRNGHAVSICPRAEGSGLRTDVELGTWIAGCNVESDMLSSEKVLSRGERFRDRHIMEAYKHNHRKK
jgi:hypothetical protein